MLVVRRRSCANSAALHLAVHLVSLALQSLALNVGLFMGARQR